MNLPRNVKSYVIRSVVTLLALIIVQKAGQLQASAQAVRPDLTLTRPASGVAIDAGVWLESERPRVALHRPPTAASSARIRDAVTDWELLLLGLGVPYTVIDDEELERGPGRHIDVLILAAAAQTDAAGITAADRFVRAGGGLIVAGVPSEDPAAASLLGRLLGAHFESPGIEDAGAYQVLDRTPGLATGIPAGFRLNVAVREGFMTARPVTATPVGPIEWYGTEQASPLRGSTAALVASAGEGRVVWTGFVPQDVSDEEDQQHAWQQFVAGALATGAGLSTVTVEAWPRGAPAVLAIAVLPSPGFDPVTMLRNAGHLVEYLERENVPASFFLPGAELTIFPELTRRMDAAGEFGFTTRSEQLLHGQSADVQRARIREGAADVSSATAMNGFAESGAVMRSAASGVGFLPPGLLFDGATLQALQAEGIGYLLRWGGPSLMPDSVAVHNHVDFRRADRRSSVTTVPLGPEAPADIAAGYDRALEAGGLFVMPWRVEEIAPGSVRFDALTGLIARARRDGVVIRPIGDVLDWIEARSVVEVNARIEEERSILTISVENPGLTDVSGIVLRLDPGRSVLSDGWSVSDESVRITVDHESGTLLLALPELEAGSTLDFVTRGQ